MPQSSAGRGSISVDCLRTKWWLILSLTGLALARTAAGEELPGALAAARFEVTPFAGYRFGGNFDVTASQQDADVHSHASYGIALGIRGAEAIRYELFYSRQPTQIASSSPAGAADLDVDYLQLGVSQPLGDQQRLKPYLLGAIGITRLSLDAPETSDETRFSLSMAAGLRVPVRDRFDVRIEARGYLTFMSADSSVFCASTGTGSACALRASGSAFVQFELLAGAAFSF